jgi:BirA family biotin operon repressor/biotin-[acetyl-CoA-carboxylase] ligase
MDQKALEAVLADLPLGAVRYYQQLGSTNDEAARWADQGAPELALVLADEQTAGRGRAGRRWFTPPGSALAFSLVLYPTRDEFAYLTRMTSLGALAVCTALQYSYSLSAEVKWPNDVLLDRRKVAGVLAEAKWAGERLVSLILGIGINVAPPSIPKASPEVEHHFPVTCVETVLGRPIDRLELLHYVLAEFLHWRSRLPTPDFMLAWEANLAFRGEWVQISPGESQVNDGISPTVESLHAPVQEGQIVGLASDGSLKLRTCSGKVETVQIGEVRLRPAIA